MWGGGGVGVGRVCVFACVCVCVRACVRVLCAESWKHVHLRNVLSLRTCAS